MRYTVDGLLQTKIIEYKLNDRQIKLICYVRDLMAAGKMSPLTTDGKLFFWFKYESFIQEYPYLAIPNTKTVGELVLELQKKGVIEKYIDRNPSGTFTYVRLTDKYYEFITAKPENYTIKSNEGGAAVGAGGAAVGAGVSEKSAGVSGKSSSHTNPSTNNPSTNNQSTTINNDVNEVYQLWQKLTGKHHNSESAKTTAIETIAKFIKKYGKDTVINVVEFISTNPFYKRGNYTGIDNIFRTTKFSEKILAADAWISNHKKHRDLPTERASYHTMGDFTGQEPGEVKF